MIWMGARMCGLQINDDPRLTKSSISGVLAVNVINWVFGRARASEGYRAGSIRGDWNRRFSSVAASMSVPGLAGLPVYRSVWRPDLLTTILGLIDRVGGGLTVTTNFSIFRSPALETARRNYGRRRVARTFTKGPNLPPMTIPWRSSPRFCFARPLNQRVDGVFVGATSEGSGGEHQW